MSKPYGILLLVLCLGIQSCVGQRAFDARFLKDKIKDGASVIVQDQEIDVPILFGQYATSDIIGKDMIERRVSSSITFLNCTFKAPVGYRKNEQEIAQLTFERNLSFVGCTFQDSVLFANIKVLGRTDFTKSTFKKEANFQNAQFEDVVTFSNAEFQYEAKFQNAFFNRNASFFKAEFLGNSFFNGCFFHLKANFGASTFYEYGNFGLTTFSERTNFNHTKFLGRGSFSNSVLKELVTFNSCQFGNYTFEKSSFRMSAQFQVIKIDERLDFQEAVYQNGPIELSTANPDDEVKISNLDKDNGNP